MKYGTLKDQRRRRRAALKVPELIRQVEEIGRRHDTFVANFGPRRRRQHSRQFLCDRDDRLRSPVLGDALKETFALSVTLGGSISGEHGIGYVKAAYLDMAIDAPTLEIMKAIKRVFDPHGILNQGKSLSSAVIL
jgi:FAD/FMN-containing dehydrogenase